MQRSLWINFHSLHLTYAQAGVPDAITVQLETFGRELVGYKDKLLNYRLAMLEIQDASVIKLSGKTHHPI
jgi:hypothetical protein